MKKLIVSAALLLAASVVHADVSWCWWMNKKDVATDIGLGIANRFKEVDACEISALYGSSPVKSALQWSVFGINDSESNCALQFSFWFNRGKAPCAQVAFVNTANEATLDFGFVNFADKASVQIGLLNFNKNGFLPVFPFINLDKSLFD